MENKTIHFKEGIPGFNHLKRYILLEETNSMFLHLQSVEEQNIGFVVVDPYQLMPEYTPSINEGYFEKLGGGDTCDYALYTIVTIGKTLEETTINLKAPLLINIKTREALQVLVEEGKYNMHHKIDTLLAKKGA